MLVKTFSFFSLKLPFLVCLCLATPSEKFRKMIEFTQALNNLLCARFLEKFSKTHRIIGILENYFPNVLHMAVVE